MAVSCVNVFCLAGWHICEVNSTDRPAASGAEIRLPDGELVAHVIDKGRGVKWSRKEAPIVRKSRCLEGIAVREWKL